MLRVQAQNKFVSPGFMANWRHPVYKILSQKDPCDLRNVICKLYLLSLICAPVEAKLNKSPLRERPDLSPLRDWSAFSPQAGHYPGQLGELCGTKLPHSRCPEYPSELSWFYRYLVFQCLCAILQL